MIILSPSQYATANDVLAALTREGSFCLVSSEPGFGLPTCMAYVRSRLAKPIFTIADHPELSGLDLLGQLYHQLHIDVEFQGKNEIPKFVVEIVTLREVSTIFIDHIDIFLGNESARRRTIQQIKSILIALPLVNIVVSGLHSDMSAMLDLQGCSLHFAQTFSLKGFRDFNEYQIFLNRSLLDTHLRSLQTYPWKSFTTKPKVISAIQFCDCSTACTCIKVKVDDGLHRLLTDRGRTSIVLALQAEQGF